MFKDASEALTFIEKENVALVDVRFCDLPGVMQHFTIPVAAFKDEAPFSASVAFNSLSANNSFTLVCASSKFPSTP